MQNVICFGAGGGAFKLFEQISNRYKIIGFTDNDAKKWGGRVNGISVYSLDECLKQKYDKIVITSAPGLDSIKKQLIKLGIEENIIDDSFVTAPLESRRIFLEKLASMHKDLEENICVAEAGVFEGDFAKYINKYYPYRWLYLFDTFEGFHARDIEKEWEMSDAKVGDYSNTSEELVLSKMTYKNNCRIYKGYFPDTAKDINEKFCFVNLDLDLFEPTYRGLEFFEDKIVKDGVILVHDYFADNFRGPKEAVDRFVSKGDGKYIVIPIGDGLSIALIKK